MTLDAEQAARLDAILPWAREVGALRGAWRPAEQLVHLRPSSRGIRVVDLDPERPQLDRGHIGASRSVPGNVYDALQRALDAHPTTVPARPTPEKRLQSWLIAEAYRHPAQCLPFAADLVFVTDEQVFPTESGKVVCDLLALRDGAPAVVELKSAREMARLIKQLEDASEVVDLHRDRFAALYSAILGRDVALDRACERWLVWPALPGRDIEPRATELNALGIHVVSYTETGRGFAFELYSPSS